MSHSLAEFLPETNAKCEKPVKIDIGCGPNKKDGFIGIDIRPFPGVDLMFDIGKDRWPFEDNSVEESHCSHTIEHLTNFEGKFERVNFLNELFRVTVPGGKCALIFPHWCSNRFHGDFTHREPLSEFFFYYLDRLWRTQNAPHTDIAHNPNGYDCNWNCTWGYTMRQDLGVRNAEYQQFAMANYKEAILDIVATMTATKEASK